MYKKDNKESIEKLLAAIVVLVILSLFDIAFDCIKVYGAKDTVTITVTDKTVKRYGNGDEDLIYTDGETFELTDELLAARFDSSDDYGRIQVDKTYKATVCGWRVPLFSWYRNIIEISEVTNS